MRLIPRLSAVGFRRAGTFVLSNRLLSVLGLLVVITGVWFAVAFDDPQPVPLLWLPALISAVVLSVMFWRTSRCAWLSPITRRFWRDLAVAGVLVGAGSAVQAVDVLRQPGVPGPHTSPLMLSINGVAIAVIMLALYRLPLGRRTAAERLRVALDAGTVMAAAAIFIWHFQTRHAVDAQDDMTLIASALLIVLAQLAVFAVVKVVLSSHAFVDKTALRLLALGMLVGSLSPPLAGAIEQHSHLLVNQLSNPVVFFIAACAAQRQRSARSTQAPGVADVRPRSFSMLPYVAVAAVDTLLLVSIWSGDGDARVVGGVAVLVTGLVVLRQLTAFRDNHQLLDQLDHTATHDALTQLPNRTLFGLRLRQALAGDGSTTASVVLIDLDDFKTVNDTLGHAAGDALLMAVADRLRDAVRAGDTVARLGGDEFAIVLQGDGTAAEHVISRIITELGAGVDLEGRHHSIRASFGVAQGRPGDDPGDVLRRADIAMYEAKARGDGSWEHYVSGMRARGAEASEAAARLRRALHDDELRLHYQPVVTLQAGDMVGVEALIRWQHPERGLLGPADIIPVAEASGLIVDVGRWVLREACRQLATWRRAHPGTAPRTISINVSARQLREPSFAGEVIAALSDNGLAPHHLTIEITESAAVGGGATAATLAKLHAVGVRISLDDFGTGQSTLTLLATLPIDQIKLDRSFVPDGGSDVIATAVLQLARGFGVETIAEGVETTSQVQSLLALGYDRAQGYHFARPVSADGLDTLMTLHEGTGRQSHPNASDAEAVRPAGHGGQPPCDLPHDGGLCPEIGVGSRS
jgi:diguanylate cyclase (GGDEF)-like protein